MKLGSVSVPAAVEARPQTRPRKFSWILTAVKICVAASRPCTHTHTYVIGCNWPVVPSVGEKKVMPILLHAIGWANLARRYHRGTLIGSRLLSPLAAEPTSSEQPQGTVLYCTVLYCTGLGRIERSSAVPRDRRPSGPCSLEGGGSRDLREPAFAEYYGCL